MLTNCAGGGGGGVYSFLYATITVDPPASPNKYHYKVSIASFSRGDFWRDSVTRHTIQN